MLKKLLSSLALAASLLTPAFAADAPLMPPTEAFRFATSAEQGELVINWTVEPGYYLYRQKISFASLTEGVSLEKALMPRGEDHEDEFFGAQQIYTKAFQVRIPYQANGASSVELQIKSQGCSDVHGICFPPQTQTATIALAAGAATGSAANALVPLGNAPGANTARKDLFARTASNDFLPADQAFKPLITIIDGNLIEIDWQIAPDYYLYRNAFKAQFADNEVQAGSLALPPGKAKFDEYFGDTEVYYESVFAKLPIKRNVEGSGTYTLLLAYQGCAEDGICYPVIEREFEISLPAGSTSFTLPAATLAADSGGFVSEQDRLARLVGEGNLLLVLATFFAAGLLLAFTPCVLPMIPILSGIIAGEGDDVTPMRGFSLAALYVLGMALTYTIAGGLFAMAGQQAQSVFQQPWILITFAALFVILALGMFGMFTLQMPSAIQSRVAKISGKQKSGTAIGAFIMGALSSLVVTACVAPPLVAALAVIGQTGDVVRGSLALFFLAIGMGTPLLVIGASAGRLLPKVGPWMDDVKQAFGFVMLGLAIYMLSRLIPAGVSLLLWAILIFIAGVFLGGVSHLSENASGGKKLAKGFGALAMLYGILMFIGALSGGHDPLQPLRGSSIGGGGGGSEHAELVFTRVKSLNDLQSAVAAASAQNKTVMFDFYADWCVSCKEMEKYTFTDPEVMRVLNNTVLLQADVTANDATDQELLQHFNIFGPPSIIFFGTDGNPRPAYQVVGYMKAARFAAHAKEAIAN